jgi:hypothetical protein
MYGYDDSYPADNGTTDDFHSPDPVTLEADELRRAAWADERERSEKRSGARLDQYGTKAMRRA